MRREATIYAGRPIQASAVAEPQYNGYRRPSTDAAASRSDIHHMRRRGAKSFVDDLVLSRGVVLSRAELFCDLLRLSPMTRRFVRFRRTYLRLVFSLPQLPELRRTLDSRVVVRRCHCCPFRSDALRNSLFDQSRSATARTTLRPLAGWLNYPRAAHCAEQ